LKLEDLSLHQCIAKVIVIVWIFKDGGYSEWLMQEDCSKLIKTNAQNTHKQVCENLQLFYESNTKYTQSKKQQQKKNVLGSKACFA